MKKCSSILSLLLLAAMALSLAACGSGDSTAPTGGTEGGNASPAGSEYVYAPEFTALKLDGDAVDRLSFPLAEDGGYYAYQQETVGKRELRAGESLDYEGQLDRVTARLFFITPDATVTPVEGYSPVELPEVADDHDIRANVTALLRTDEGFMEIIDLNESWVDAPEGIDSSSMEYWQYWKNNETYYLRTLDSSGAVRDTVELDVSRFLDEDGYFYIGSAALDGDRLVVCSEKLCLFDVHTGALLSTIDAFDYPEKLITLSDGRLAVGAWGDTGPELTVLSNGKTGEKLPLRPGVDLYRLTDGSGDYLYYYSDGTSLYGAKADGDEKLLSWISCAVNPTRLQSYTVAEDGGVTGIEQQWKSKLNRSEIEMVTLRRVPAASLGEKTTLTLATQGLNYYATDLIIAFNRSHPTARIEVVDYSEYNTEDDYSAGLTKLKTELLSGHMPDILDLNAMPVDQLGARALLQDLYPFLDADSEITRESFFPSLLTALERGGKLYGIPSSFSVITLAAASRLVGDEPGWTMAELQEALRELPEGATAFSPYTSRNDMLSYSLVVDLDRYVDWETGKVSFTDPGFSEMLEYCAQFPDESAINYEDIEDDEPARISAGKQLTTVAYLSDFISMYQYYYLFGGSEDAYTLIGFPTAEGVGSLFEVSQGAYAITRDCKDSRLAWEFIRSVLSEDTQLENYSAGFPTNRAAFDKRLEEAMTPQYEKDADGNYKLDANGERIERSLGGFGFGDGTMYQYYALTQPMADKLLEAIDHTTRTTSTNEEILKIVTEQAEAFFAGDKTAEETAKLIQSKANIYVNEQR